MDGRRRWRLRVQSDYHTLHSKKTVRFSHYLPGLTHPKYVFRWHRTGPQIPFSFKTPVCSIKMCIVVLTATFDVKSLTGGFGNVPPSTRIVLFETDNFTVKNKNKTVYPSRSAKLVQCDFPVYTPWCFNRVGSYLLTVVVVVVVVYKSDVKEKSRGTNKTHSDCLTCGAEPGQKKINKKQIIVRRKRVYFIL